MHLQAGLCSRFWLFIYHMPKSVCSALYDVFAARCKMVVTKQVLDLHYVSSFLWLFVYHKPKSVHRASKDVFTAMKRVD